jgi:hypothetical protein
LQALTKFIKKHATHSFTLPKKKSKDDDDEAETEAEGSDAKDEL